MSWPSEWGLRARSATISILWEYDGSTFLMESSICDCVWIKRVWWVDPPKGDGEFNPWQCPSLESTISQPFKRGCRAQSAIVCELGGLMSWPFERGWRAQCATISKSGEFDESTLWERMESLIRDLCPSRKSLMSWLFERGWRARSTNVSEFDESTLWEGMKSLIYDC